MSFALRVGESPRAALRRLAGDTLDRATTRVEGALAPGQADDVVDVAVHETRKTCKSLRALLRMFRPGLGPTYSRENAALRDAAQGLATARDERVLRQTLARLAERFPGAQEAAAVAAAAGALDSSAPAAIDPRAALVAVIAPLRSLHERARRWKFAGGRGAVALGVRQTYRDGRAALAACHRDPEDERLHAWRKLVKHHTAQVLLLRKLRAPLVDAYAAPFVRLSSVLGDEHDLSVLVARVAATPALDPESRALVSRRATELRAELRAQGLEWGDGLYASPPRLVEDVVHSLLKG